MAALLWGRSIAIERPYLFTSRVEIDLKFWMIAPNDPEMVPLKVRKGEAFAVFVFSLIEFSANASPLLQRIFYNVASNSI